MHKNVSVWRLECKRVVSNNCHGETTGGGRIHRLMLLRYTMVVLVKTVDTNQPTALPVSYVVLCAISYRLNFN